MDGRDLRDIEERLKPAVQQLLDRAWQGFILVQLRQNIAAFTEENWRTLNAIVSAEAARRSASA